MKIFKKLKNINKIKNSMFTTAVNHAFIMAKQKQFNPLLKKCEAVVSGEYKKEDSVYWENTVLNKMLAAAGNDPSPQVKFFRSWINKLIKHINDGTVGVGDKTIMNKEFIPYINLTLNKDFNRSRNISFKGFEIEKTGGENID